MFFFHKGLMGLGWMASPAGAMTDVPETAFALPFGRAEVRRPGRDLTLVSVAMGVHRSLEAAERLSADGIEAEVLDLRTLVPLDRQAIVDSVRRTHRLLIVDEDYLSFGMSGEVAATVAESALDYLDVPVRRVAVPDVPIPYSRPLEQAVLPSADRIVAAAREIVA
jgi:pyruvate/2-oxoglutarate/acetoin dehydrogenase E1 component